MFRKKLMKKEGLLAVMGMGYVGMPLAIAFDNAGIDVIGFDLNEDKINLYKKGIDPTDEVGNNVIKSSNINFTTDERRLGDAVFVIVAVPTPVNQDHTPNLDPIISACKIIGKNMKRNCMIVFESTVYPGVTDDVCIPLLEKESNMKCGKDFWVGYSPERINPSDKEHTLKTICKIVSGCDDWSAEEVNKVYSMVIDHTHVVSNIKTAEAIKVVENSQRDINIAFMNEIAMVFDCMDIDTGEVLEGMNTKWNALGFKPGLVGGHCIGVDPYYFIYKAERLGYHSQIIMAGRKINDGMGKYIAMAAMKQMILADMTLSKVKIAILGLTFKENCPDIRNSKVLDIIETFKEYNMNVVVHDPIADAKEAKSVYEIGLVSLEEALSADCIIVAVPHACFSEIKWEKTDRNKVIVDVKGCLDKKMILKQNNRYWRL